MPIKIEQIIFDLITTGTSYTVTDPAPLNTLLTPIEYSAIIWYDQSCLILKDNKSVKTSRNINKIKSMIQLILNKKPLFKDKDLEYLLENNLVEIKNEELNVYELSKRFYVNYEDFLLENGFNKCEFCGIVGEGKFHEYCKFRYEECVKNVNCESLLD